MAIDTLAESVAESVAGSVLECVGDTPAVALNRLFPETDVEVIAKLELMNPGGSMKDRSAQHIVECGLRQGTIRPGSHLVESSSGNFGIAVAIAARVHGLRFTCVLDPKAASANVAILRRIGAEVDIVDEPDETGGYLHTRVRRVQEIVANSPNAVWLNQYANDCNWQAHYYGTGAELCRQLVTAPSYLFGAVSTTGSLLGCSRRMRESFPDLRAVAVDAVGSVIFGGAPGKRDVPGLGASRVPELLSPDEIDEVVHVNDLESAEACRDLLATEGIFAGGSTGAVIAAIRRALPELPRPCRVVAVFPDRGDRYLDLIYDDEWLAAARERCAG
ncbi:2,3-diaminopropionate biosynthesis protein SbnA [Saccharopolyspora halophila]|uniref:N-(2-amino-2-carboxyethyl)-L-glutamate synthase n=1 Tax=Saccharopolyspora halophila TaxID=405551 RepID=A0ABN3GTR5_9PSEU